MILYFDKEYSSDYRFDLANCLVCMQPFSPDDFEENYYDEDYGPSGQALGCSACDSAVYLSGKYFSSNKYHLRIEGIKIPGGYIRYVKESNKIVFNTSFTNNSIIISNSNQLDTQTIKDISKLCIIQ